MFFCVPRTKRTNRVLPQAAQTKQITTSAETKTREQVHTDNSHPYYHAPADGSHPASMTPTMTPYLIVFKALPTPTTMVVSHATTISRQGKQRRRKQAAQQQQQRKAPTTLRYAPTTKTTCRKQQ